MKKFRSLFILIGTLGLITLLLFLYKYFVYEHEIHQIENRLNEIENTEVVNIWGNKDVTLEDISVRLRIKDKGELVLPGISQDNFNYPKKSYFKRNWRLYIYYFFKVMEELDRV